MDILLFHLDKHPQRYIPEDQTTHRVNYIESIMTPDGKVYYLTLGAHLDNALYICLGGTTNSFYGVERLSYKSIDESYYSIDEYDLCHEFGIASIHNADYIIYDAITPAMYHTFYEMYKLKHISYKMFSKIKKSFRKETVL